MIEDRRPIVVEQPAPPPESVDIQRSEPILGGVETIRRDKVNGFDCTTRTVSRQTLLGSETVRNRRCD